MFGDMKHLQLRLQVSVYIIDNPLASLHIRFPILLYNHRADEVPSYCIPQLLYPNPKALFPCYDCSFLLSPTLSRTSLRLVNPSTFPSTHSQSPVDLTTYLHLPPSLQSFPCQLNPSTVLGRITPQPGQTASLYRVPTISRPQVEVFKGLTVKRRFRGVAVRF